MPYGVLGYTHTTATIISTGVTTVLAANTNRRYAAFYNLSTSATVWLGLSTATVAAGLGIPLNPATATSGVGGSFTMSLLDGNLTQRAVTAIANTTAAALSIVEGA